MTNNQQDRRERIAAQVLASIIASDMGYPSSGDVEHAIRRAFRYADALIAELDRTATPINQPEKPEGWVIWDDSDCQD